MDTNLVPQQDPNNPNTTILTNLATMLVWSRRDRDTIYSIVTSIKDLVLMLIQHVNMTLKSWAFLKAEYETQNETKKENLETQLANEKMHEAKSAEKLSEG